MTPRKPEHLLIKRRRMVSETLKECKNCGEIKHVDEFQKMKHYERPGSPSYWAARCKPCASEYNRLRLYGVTLNEMIERQANALCPLCITREAICLDHDHATGEARGALCQPCNRALHYLENEAWMKRAEEYLARKI